MKRIGLDTRRRQLAALVVVAMVAIGGGQVVVSTVCACAPPAPEAAQWPVVTGTSTVGGALTTTNGTWVSSGNHTGESRSYAYLWKACTSATDIGTCSDASGTPNDAATYTVADADIGNYLRSQVTATNGSGSTSQYSSATGIVAANGTLTFNGDFNTADPTVGYGAAAWTAHGGDIQCQPWYQSANYHFRSVWGPTIATLRSPLSPTGGAISSLPINSTSVSLTNGESLSLSGNDGLSPQQWRVNGDQSGTVTSINVNSQTPNVAYPTDAPVNANTLVQWHGRQAAVVDNITDTNPTTFYSETCNLLGGGRAQDSAAGGYTLPLPNEQFIGESFWIPTGFTIPNSTGRTNIEEFHYGNGGLPATTPQPPIAVYLYDLTHQASGAGNGQVETQINSGSFNTSTQQYAYNSGNGNGGLAGCYAIPNGQLTQDAWNDVIVDVRWADDNTGYVKDYYRAAGGTWQASCDEEGFPTASWNNSTLPGATDHWYDDTIMNYGAASTSDFPLYFAGEWVGTTLSVVENAMP